MAFRDTPQMNGIFLTPSSPPHSAPAAKNSSMNKPTSILLTCAASLWVWASISAIVAGLAYAIYGVGAVVLEIITQP